MTTPTPNDFTPARLAALDIFTNHSEILTWRSAQFLGQVAGGFDDDLSDKQEAWLQKLVQRAGLPPLAGE